MMENLKELFENIEKTKKLLEGQEVTLKESDEKVKQAANTLSEKIDSLKGKIHLKQLSIVSAIEEKEKQISKLVADTLLDQEPSEELRNLSIELDILKRQEAAVEDGLRKTIIAGTEKEIKSLRATQKDATIQLHAVYKIYNIYFKEIAVAIKLLENMRKNKSDKHVNYQSSVVNGLNIDILKPFMNLVYDCDVCEPGTTGEEPSAYELAIRFNNEIETECIGIANTMIDNMKTSTLVDQIIKDLGFTTVGLEI